MTDDIFEDRDETERPELLDKPEPEPLVRPPERDPDAIITDEHWDAVLEYIERHGLVMRACRHARISHSAFNARVNRDEVFAGRVAEAQGMHDEALEEEIRRRGFDGVKKAVFHKGCRVDDGKVVEYSDRLAELYIKRRIAAYREKVADVTVNEGVLVVNATPETTKDWLASHRKRKPKDGEGDQQ